MGTGNSPGNVTVYGGDSRDNATSSSPPTGATATFGAYSTIAGVDLPPSSTDAQGNRTSYSYDARDRLTDVATSGGAAGGASVVYVFGGDGNLRSRTDATGTTTHLPDTLDRETVRTRKPPETASMMGGPVGGAAAITGSCALGGFMGHEGADTISYG